MTPAADIGGRRALPARSDMEVGKSIHLVCETSVRFHLAKHELQDLRWCRTRQPRERARQGRYDAQAKATG